MSFGLVTALCLSMFTGCGNQDLNQGEGNDPTSTPTATPSPSGTDNQGEEARFVENIYDMGGKTIKICDTWIWDELAGDPSTFSRWETNALATIEQIEKDYNVNIEFMFSSPFETGESVATSVAAGQVYANIFVTRNDLNLAMGWVDSYAADVNTIQNLGLGTNDWNECTDSNMSSNGEKQIGVSFNVETDPAQQMLVLIFNKDLAEQYEIEDIYELVRNNEWTYDKFKEICSDITTKSNGAVKGLLTAEFELGYFAATNGLDCVIEQDGKYVYNGLSEEVVTGLEFAQSLVSEGLFDLDLYAESGIDGNGERSHQFGREHKTLFFVCSYPWLVSDIDYRLENYGIVPLPMGPDSDGYVGVLQYEKMFNFIEGDPDIEDAAAVLVAIANRLSLTDEEFYQAQYDRGYIRDEESFEFMKMMLENSVSTYEFERYVPHTNVYSLDKTVRQFLEETKQESQAKVDETLNK